MHSARTTCVRNKIRGVPFSEAWRYEYLFQLEEWAMHGPNGFAEAIAMDHRTRNAWQDWNAIRDELDPSWREREAARRRKEEAVGTRERAEAERAHRAEMAAAKRAWVGSGGALD